MLRYDTKLFERKNRNFQFKSFQSKIQTMMNKWKFFCENRIQSLRDCFKIWVFRVDFNDAVFFAAKVIKNNLLPARIDFRLIVLASAAAIKEQQNAKFINPKKLF